MVDSKVIEELRDYLNQSKYAVVLTGAGISTESGIPDFRSKDGWWNKINPAEVASVNALENNYELFREFYKYRIKMLDGCKFNRGHRILADWEDKGLVKSVVTQNIDGFHKDAGSKRVYELHGSISAIRCYVCEKEHSVEDFVNDKRCEVCGGNLRPGVVLFGEGLPSDVWQEAYDEILKSDLLLVIGTSLNVSPVNSLPTVAKGKRVLINAEKTFMDDIFDLVINAGAGMVLESVDRGL
ncbi:MAG: NAD-dependent deacylase [Clostridiales bacterium]|nr:NAD-dependent deacylase [Clostridiales bacterium]